MARAGMTVADSDIQLSMPWGKEEPARRRRREAELSDQLRHERRRIYRLVRDLREARAIAEGLRRDLAAMASERDDALARLNGQRLREPVEGADVDPRRFGRRAGR